MGFQVVKTPQAALRDAVEVKMGVKMIQVGFRDIFYDSSNTKVLSGYYYDLFGPLYSPSRRQTSRCWPRFGSPTSDGSETPQKPLWIADKVVVMGFTSLRSK